MTYSQHEKQNIIQNMSILYIEDEDNIRENVTKTLELLCKKVTSFSNAEEALLYIRTNPIDIVISDINLPKMNGLELSRYIRKNDNTIPIILLTAYTDTNLLLEAAKLKLVDYLTKPINFDKLTNALLNACKDILDNSRYKIIFNNNVEYNIQQKTLINLTTKEDVALTNKEILLLEYLLKNNSRVVSHVELKDYIWEDSLDGTDSALKNVLNKIRKKIGKDSIQNISGVGFRIII